MSPTVHFGAGSVQDLPDYLVSKYGAGASVLLIHGRSSFRTSGAAVHFETRASNALVVHRFDGVAPNPNLETVTNAAAAMRTCAPVAVVAVGGGSLIDTAKGAIALRAANSVEEVLRNEFRLPDDRPEFIAVPTTAGSGSEATHFAVLYVESVKYSLAHRRLQPDTVWLDPELLLSCPAPLAYSSGADAICQCIESWWNAFATDESRIHAANGLRHLLPFDMNRREANLLGAHEAGRAINITKTTAGHALSYGLTSRFGVPHGLAVLAVMQQLVRETPVPELDPFFRCYGADFQTGFDVLCEEIWKNVAITQHFHDFSAADIEPLVETVNVERLRNHPTPLESSDISRLYRSVFNRHADYCL